MNDVIVGILFIVVIGLIVADLVTRRKNNRVITFLTVVAAALFPFIFYVIPEQFKHLGLLAVTMILESYFCLRLFTSKYRYLREPASGRVEVKGAKCLLGFAALYNVATFAAFVIGFVVIVGVSGISFWIGVAAVLSFVVEMIAGNFSVITTYAEVGIFAILYVVPLLILAGIEIVLFILTPVIMALRALKGASRQLRLSGVKIACYAFFLILPYLNIIPMIILWARCLLHKRRQAENPVA